MSVSISARLALGYALTLALLLGAFAVFSFAAMRQAAQRSFDRHLEHEWMAVAPLVRAGPGGGLDASALDRAPLVATRAAGPGATYVRVLDPAGAVVWSSPNLRGLDPPAGGPLVAGTHGATWRGERVRTLVAPVPAGDAHAGHGAAVPSSAAPPAGWIEVTGAEWARATEARELASALAIGVVLGLLVALAAGWALARRALRPVAVLTEAAARMAGAGTAGARLPAQFSTRDELTDLAETFNGLLGRLEAAAARERRFTADAAHELLTPLATLRSDAEVALRRAREPDAYREVLARVVAEAADMAATVRGLLALARAEAPPGGDGGHSRLDVGDLVARRVARLRPVAEARGVALAVETADGIAVAADAAPLADVVDNLVSNALKYTPAGGRVTVRVSFDAAAGVAVLSVEDTGVGFTAADGARLFERFFRAEAPAVQAEPGSGLGLAIARAVVEGAGGTLTAASDGPGRGATFRVTLPGFPPELSA